MTSWLLRRVPAFVLISMIAMVPPVTAQTDTTSARPASRPDSTATPAARPDTTAASLGVRPDSALAHDAKRDSTPPPPPSPISSIRGKISANDLLSAESLLEVYRQKYGDGGVYINALGWVARGALLLGDLEKAQRYTTETRTICRERLAKGADLEKDSDLETALGAAIEVEAQIRARERGKFAAVKYVRSELEQIKGPLSLRSRLNKRINMLSLQGSPAPELKVEDFLGAQPPLLASLKGKPVVLFLWAEGCGDCKAQSAGLARVQKRYAGRGLQTLAVTRYYDPAEKQVREKARVDSVWKAVYSEVGTVPIVFSTASMERYGVSSTPTFVFIDKSGIVRSYTPTRLSETEFDKRVDAILD
jgi:thiol-disulfide isomerase/thioredoxin